MLQYKDFRFHPTQLDYGLLARHFNNLPCDQYLSSGTRYRRLSTFEYLPIRGLFKRPHGILYQNRKNVSNKETEGVERRYHPLMQELIQETAFNQACSYFFNGAAAFVDGMFDVHQIRIQSKFEQAALAPEGPHRDGVKYVGILVVNRRNCKGGKACLYTNKESKLDFPSIEKPMIPGLWMIFSDEEFRHYGTPIEPVLESLGPATLDFFVFTTPSLIRYG